ncbi:hypothetical protein HNR42_000733 [Deinobacterium chartae]|uniref:Cytochrome c domain-containing protein n=1 Tax=Deinobacterium chartae TaxID=521158 RepID=A0A841HYM2_9DEIO|nr:hypothetical protein [Deinobacterium chartae]MBB6097319.1 hypothetical protein [Deinobacterium chartae]
MQRKHVWILTTLALVGMGAWATGQVAANAALPNPALNAPNQVSWELFARVNQPAPGTPPEANESLWETWATDEDTFLDPNNARAVPAPTFCRQNPPTVPDYALRCPVWPGETYRPETPLDSKQQVVADQSQQGHPHSPPALQDAPGVPDELVYRNRIAFDYIVENGLWYVEGLQDAYFRGFEVSFPLGSIEVKSNWKEIAESDKARYHWKRGANGKLYGMTAMHLMSKDLPIWTWQTFEHVDNPGRCDFIGCHDSFGQVPADVPPQAVMNRTYPAEQLTPAVLALFERYGVREQFRNYRLKGSQNEFTDNTGRPTLLGNSVTEQGFVPTSSCTTCHARASAGMVTQTNRTIGGRTYTVNVNDRLSVFETTQPLSGSVGSPNPAWYYNSEGRRKLMPMDFVWAFFNAKSAVPPTPQAP